MFGEGGREGGGVAVVVCVWSELLRMRGRRTYRYGTHDRTLIGASIAPELKHKVHRNAAYLVRCWAKKEKILLLF